MRTSGTVELLNDFRGDSRGSVAENRLTPGQRPQARGQWRASGRREFRRSVLLRVRPHDLLRVVLLRVRQDVLLRVILLRVGHRLLFHDRSPRRDPAITGQGLTDRLLAIGKHNPRHTGYPEVPPITPFSVGLPLSDKPSVGT